MFIAYNIRIKKSKRPEKGNFCKIYAKNGSIKTALRVQIKYCQLWLDFVVQERPGEGGGGASSVVQVVRKLYQ